MRKLKFRAWIHWVKEPYMHYSTWEDLTDLISADDENEHSIMAGTTESIIMQYTGLKDKNGVEIFEGDIVQYSGDDKQYVVYYNELTAQFTTDDRWLWGYDDIEVIGNIYDNPEPLEAKQNENL